MLPTPPPRALSSRYADDDLAVHLRSSKETFGKYMKGRETFLKGEIQRAAGVAASAAASAAKAEVEGLKRDSKAAAGAAAAELEKVKKDAAAYRLNIAEAAAAAIAAKAKKAKEEEEKREQEEEQCIVCFDDDFPPDGGLLCMHRGGRDDAHFICDGCLCKKLLSMKEADALAVLAKNQGRCYCEEGGLAASHSCASKYYSDADLALHTRSNPDAFEAYLGARKTLLKEQIEAESAEEMETRLAAELARFEALSERDRKVYVARKRIIDEIITLRCPRCKKAFVDFANCFAIECSSKPKHFFCGWCLKDCGDDFKAAHTHVASCPEKPANAGTYYASPDASVDKQMFAAQNRTRQKKMLLKFFAEEVDPEILESVLTSVCADLYDLGMGDFIREQLNKF